jgi:hypothetical protein
MKTDKQNKNDGKVVKVGIAQLANQTPDWARLTFRIILYLSAVYVIAVQPNLDLSNGLQAMINKWIVFGNAVMNVTIKFFGWDHPVN